MEIGHPSDGGARATGDRGEGEPNEEGGPGTGGPEIGVSLGDLNSLFNIKAQVKSTSVKISNGSDELTGTHELRVLMKVSFSWCGSRSMTLPSSSAAALLVRAAAVSGPREWCQQEVSSMRTV